MSMRRARLPDHHHAVIDLRELQVPETERQQARGRMAGIVSGGRARAESNVRNEARDEVLAPSPHSLHTR
jgi:hypothetical protein